MGKSNNDHLSLFQVLAAGGLASCFAEACTIPMDTVKVRMQNFQTTYIGMMNTYKKIFREEGLLAFYRGLSAGLLRQITFASMRLGLYDYSIQGLEKRGVQVLNYLIFLKYFLPTKLNYFES